MIQFYVFLIVTVFIPLPSNQHFIFPVDMCVLADICNHTWIPECGFERDEKYYRLFLDECDMFEYNCDYKLYFEIRNYSACFDGLGPCPPVKPCPPAPPCPKKNLLRHRHMHMGNFDPLGHTIPTVQLTPPPGFPKHMLHGKRRYTPNKNKPKKYRRHENSECESCPPCSVASSHTRTGMELKTAPTLPMKPMTRIKGITTTFWKTKIIKTSTFIKNGVKMVKIVRGFNRAYLKTTRTMNPDDSDFLE